MLAQRRLTEAQLWKKLEARGYEPLEVAEAVSRCKDDGYIDDRLYAVLYVEGARKAVGDARLCADLVKRGIDRDAARAIVAGAEVDEDARIEAAYQKIRRSQPDLTYPSIARKLERLGFPSSVIYRALRKHAADDLSGLEESTSGDGDDAPRSRFVSR
jgi:SOS response regulatory protein OraA/RecX